MKANKFEKLQEFEILNIGMMDTIQGGICSNQDSCGTDDKVCISFLPSWFKGLAHDGYCTRYDNGGVGAKVAYLQKKDDTPIYQLQDPYCNDVFTHLNHGGLDVSIS